MLTVKELRDALELDPSKDSKLERLRKSVIALFESKTQRLWNHRDGFVQTFNPGPRDVYLFSAIQPIDEDTDQVTAFAIKEWDLAQGETKEELDVDPTDYSLNREKGVIQKIRGNDWRQFVEITINAGYTAESLDAKYPQIKEAMVMQVQYMLTRNAPERLHILTTSIQRGQFATFLKDAFHPYFTEICKIFMKK